MTRKIALAAAWVAATLASMMVVSAAVGVVRDQVTDRPAGLPDVEALSVSVSSEPQVQAGTVATTSTTVAVPDSTGGQEPTTAAATSSSAPRPSDDEGSIGATDTTVEGPASSTTTPETTVETTVPPTTTTTAPPTTTTTAPPTTVAEPALEYSTYQHEVGWVRIGWRPGEVVLDGAGAAPGFVVEVKDSGPPRVEVEFRGNGEDLAFKAKWEDDGLDVEFED